jgi:radical SAM superfamily enzyme YgiQ (UPF0313 family)
MTRVLLVSAPWETNQGTFNTSDDISHYPIGIAYLHSFLESKGHIVKTEWLNNVCESDCNTRLYTTISEFNPEVIGFNTLTANRTSTFKMINNISTSHPNILIVMGGIHATIMYQQILKKHPNVIIIRGEGEITFNELINTDKLDTVDGIAYSKNKEIVKTADRDLIEILDILPFPKHDIFFKNNRKFACILTSRGCPNTCSFCCLNPTAKRKVRYRTVQNVMSEIEYLVNTYPNIEQIWIHDDSFFLDNIRAIEICDEIIKRKLKVSFVCSGRFKPITQELIRKLDDANFKMVLLGLESGNNDILKSCHKGITKDDVRKVTTMFKNAKMEICMFLITGLPGETEQTVNETYMFIQELQRIKYMYYHDIGILTVYPGTEVYDLMKQNNLITDDYWMTDLPTPCYTVDNTKNTLMLFKTHTLNHISLDKFMTIDGFKSQWTMLPHIITYVLKYKQTNIKRRVLKLLFHK